MFAIGTLSEQSKRTAFVRYWTKAAKAEFWAVVVCLLMTQSGHWVRLTVVRYWAQHSHVGH
jgi:hypothetical protein